MPQRLSFFQPLSVVSLLKLMLLGALIGLVTISFFVFSVEEAPASWGQNWRVKPLLLTPLVSALGILVFFLKDLIQPRKPWGTVLLLVVGALAYLVALWLGVIIGLDGTMWN